MSSVFDILGLRGWQCLPRGIRLLTESIRSSFSVNEVISLPGTNGDLHWESKEFGLEYVRGTNLKLKSGYLNANIELLRQTISISPCV